MNAESPDAVDASRMAAEAQIPLIFSSTNEVGDVKMQQRMERFVRRVQQDICDEITRIEKENGGTGEWTTDQHARGITKVINGKVIEKGGVAVSVISSRLDAQKARHMLGEKQLSTEFTESELSSGMPMFVAGVSMVLHPKNPHCPTVHLNYRYFELMRESGSIWWFAGGTDLTPTFVVEEEAQHFHRTYKNACDITDPAFYPKFKAECDDYFRIKHRGEARGVGGIFFDGLNDRSKEELFGYIRRCADSFLASWTPIIRKNAQRSFTEEEHRWQQLRRGRYVEFNLVYDRGTKFGLASHSELVRTESVLMSLPLTCRFEYCAPADEREKATLDILQHPRDWLGIGVGVPLLTQKQPVSK